MTITTFYWLQRLFLCRRVHLWPVLGWGWLGPQELSPDRAHPQGPVHPTPGRSRLCHQCGQAQQGHQRVRVSCLQETPSYRLDLHLPAASEDQQESRPLDPAWCRSVVRHQINLQSNFKFALICELFKKQKNFTTVWIYFLFAIFDWLPLIKCVIYIFICKTGLYDIYFKNIQKTVSARHCWEMHTEAVLLTCDLCTSFS